MKKSLLFFCLAQLLTLLPLWSEAAPKPLYNNLGEEIECIIRLQPDSNQKIWGTYTCSGGCNGLQVTAKPVYGGVAKCYGCGKPHTGEKINAPTHFKRNGKIYFIAKASAVTTMDSTEGIILSCPFCGVHSNPRKNSSCSGCGAEYDAKQVSQAVAKYKENVTRPISDPGGAPGASVGQRTTRGQMAGSTAVGQIPEPGQIRSGFTPPVQQSAAPTAVPTAGVVLSEQDTEEALSRVPTPLKVMAAGAVAAGAIGFVMWGTDTYTDIGVVTYVDSKNVIVSMEDDSQYTLNIRGDEVVAWVIGEEVEIFFTNFGGPKGAERGNAEVYSPVRER